MKNKFWKKYFLKIRKPHEKYQWWCPNIARRSPDESGKKSKTWIFEVWTLWDVYGCYMYALETWYVLYGYAIYLLGIEYAVWTCYRNMLCGHAICLLEMEYAVWAWYIHIYIYIYTYVYILYVFSVHVTHSIDRMERWPPHRHRLRLGSGGGHPITIPLYIEPRGVHHHVPLERM